MRRRTRRWRIARLVLLAVLAACGPASERVNVEIRLPDSAAFAASQITFTPAGHVRALRLEPTGVLRLETDGSALTAHMPGMCPLEVPARRGAGPDLQLSAAALLTLPSTFAQVGFDAPFSIAVETGCDEAKHVTLRWRQREGLPLLQLDQREQGRRVAGRTLPLSSYFPGGVPDGIAPVSPRTQGRYVLEASAEGLRAALPPLRVTITSIARATGLPSVAVSQRVLLGGEGWRVARAPPGSRAHVEPSSHASSFLPDVPGRFDLVNSAGRKLELSALTHDLTPLDCGRAECHAAISSAALQSPMSRAFELPFEHGQARREEQGCMLDCHVAGEAGLHDGGYRDVARTLGFQAHASTRVDQLPHALQRLAGVRCTSCHGPGAVPPQPGRSRILRADVCATCHDAPPDYNHVAQWRASRMAQSDATPETRERAECAQCHTTGGFLHRIGVRTRADLSRDPEGAVVGIGCAACHAPHGPSSGSALIRKLAPVPGLGAAVEIGDEPSAVCVPCHSPRPDQPSPAASAAALWLGRLTLPATLGGDTLQGPAPHRTLEAGCVGCHGRRDAQPTKIDHSFKVDPSRCASCHADEARWIAPRQALSARIQALWLAMAKACTGGSARPSALPPHAADVAPRCRTPELGRARYLLAVLTEDPAAFEHNAPFAHQLLDDVEAALGAP